MGKPVAFKDLAKVDPEYCNSLTWMLNNPVQDVIYETFAVDVNLPGGTIQVPLKKGGKSIDVTDDNKEEYVKLLVNWRTYQSVASQLTSLLEGFNAVIPSEYLSAFSPGELDLLLNGRPNIIISNIEDKAKYTGGFTRHSKVVKWFWESFERRTPEKRATLLCFITGAARVPLDGFEPHFQVCSGFDMSAESLPRAHTCFNQIVLPPYDSLTQLDDKIEFAVSEALISGFTLS